jgi:hypothetical protein
MGNDVFQSLWLGARLSMMERLSIESFLKAGAEYHLYSYDRIENVPRGAVVREAREILPADEIFVYRHGFGKGSPACFSDMFRYKLLLEKGGWWVDTDVVCLRPFGFASDCVVGNHRVNDEERVNGAVIRMPAGSPVARYCYEACCRVDRKRTRWGEIGPQLLQQALQTLGMSDCILPTAVFYPIDYWRIEQFFENRELPAESVAVHLWHAIWRSRGIDPDGWFPPECIYEQMRRRFITAYLPQYLTESQRRRVVARLARANAQRTPSRLKRARRWLRSLMPFRRAA